MQYRYIYIYRLCRLNQLLSTSARTQTHIHTRIRTRSYISSRTVGAHNSLSVNGRDARTHARECRHRFGIIVWIVSRAHTCINIHIHCTRTAIPNRLQRRRRRRNSTIATATTTTIMETYTHTTIYSLYTPRGSGSSLLPQLLPLSSVSHTMCGGGRIGGGTLGEHISQSQSARALALPRWRWFAPPVSVAWIN